MAYNRYNRNGGLAQGIAVLGLIAYLLHHFLGWIGLTIGVPSYVGIVVVAIQYSKYKGRKEERKRRTAPCSHGVAGALHGYKECSLCEQEKSLARIVAKKKAEEEEARKKALKEEAYREWVEKIRLPEYLLRMHPEEFEHLVCDLFERMGFEVEHTPYSGDGGIDGYLKKDGELSILQCKRVKGSVGEPVLRDLFGTMHAVGAKEGVVVTTGKVSTQARAWSQDKAIRIYELHELSTCIRAHFKEDDVVPTTFIPNKGAEGICPRCGNPLRVVNWRGKSFMGCSTYPSCRYTMATPQQKRFNGHNT